jgi:hypothetical protein
MSDVPKLDPFLIETAGSFQFQGIKDPVSLYEVLFNSQISTSFI